MAEIIGGDKVAGDKVAGDKVAGDKITVYGDVYLHPVTLRSELRHQFDPLLEEYTLLFAGREQALEGIARWISQGAGGYLVITAPAGFGKTALMAALVQSQPEAFAYHFFNPVKIPTSVEQIYFLRNVVEQMSQWHGRGGQAVPHRPDELVALYHQLLGQELPHARILILDGIDEVNWPVQNFLPHRLPPGLHLIVTLRDLGQDWQEDYGLPQDATEHQPLDGLNRQAVIQVLRSAGLTAASIVDDEALLEQFLRVAAYPARQSLHADPFCVRLLAEDLNAGVLAPDQLSDQSRGLNLYLDGWWKQVKAAAGTQAAKDLFSTLTVAQGAIGRRDLEAVNPSLVDDWAGDFFEEIIEQVRHFVVGDDRSGYTLAHPRLQRYMQWRLRNLDQYEERLLAYCRRWSEYDLPSAYCLAHYSRHLANAGQSKDLYDLVAQDWMAAKYSLFQSHRSFAEDLALIAEYAAARGVEDLPSLIRACLVSNELSTTAPPEILAVLTQIGQVRRALDYAALMPDEVDRNEAYRQIGIAAQQRGDNEEARDAFAAAGIDETAGKEMTLQARRPSVYWSHLAGLAPGFLAWMQGEEVSLDRLIDAAGQRLAEPKLAAVVDILNAYARRQEAPEEAFAALKRTISQYINWTYPIRDALFVQEVAETLVRAGWSDRMRQIADIAPDEALRAWILAQLAVGLARAGDYAAAGQAAADVKALDEAGALAGSPELAEVHWLATPTLTAVAQALAIAERYAEAEEAVNRVLTRTQAAGFETEKCGALIALAWALLENQRPTNAGEAARLAAATAQGILDPWDQASIYEQLLPLLDELGEQALAVDVAQQLLPMASLLGEAQLVDNLVAIARLLAPAVDPVQLAARMRESAEYEPFMHGEEVAAVLAPAALDLAQLGLSDLAAALAAELLDLWPHNAGEVLAGITTALAYGDQHPKAWDLIEQTLGSLDLDEAEKLEEMLALIESMALGLAEAGLPVLAGQVVQAVPDLEEREALLAEIELLEAQPWPQVERGVAAETAEDTPARRAMTARKAARFVQRFNQRLMAGGMPDRIKIYLALQEAAVDLAAVDNGRTVALLLESILAVDRWWGRV